MATIDNSPLKKLYFKDRKTWRKWLSKNHNNSKGIWFIFYKKHTGKPTVSYDEAVEEALCYGWIDSLQNTIDNEKHGQLMTPRKPKSPWSRLNKMRIERLISEGLMAEPGLKLIEQAKVDGSWSIYDEVEDLIVPKDLEMALKKEKLAYDNFMNFSPSNIKALLWWIKTAKRVETRADRINELATQAKENTHPLASKK